MAKKGIKSQRGQGEIWDETKKNYTIAVTPTAIAGLDELAKEAGLSRSEFVERIGRKVITVNSSSSVKPKIDIN